MCELTLRSGSFWWVLRGERGKTGAAPRRAGRRDFRRGERFERARGRKNSTPPRPAPAPAREQKKSHLHLSGALGAPPVQCPCTHPHAPPFCMVDWLDDEALLGALTDGPTGPSGLSHLTGEQAGARRRERGGGEGRQGGGAGPGCAASGNGGAAAARARARLSQPHPNLTPPLRGGIAIRCCGRRGAGRGVGFWGLWAAREQSEHGGGGGGGDKKKRGRRSPLRLSSGGQGRPRPDHAAPRHGTPVPRVCTRAPAASADAPATDYEGRDVAGAPPLCPLATKNTPDPPRSPGPPPPITPLSPADEERLFHALGDGFNDLGGVVGGEGDDDGEDDGIDEKQVSRERGGRMQFPRGGCPLGRGKGGEGRGREGKGGPHRRPWPLPAPAARSGGWLVGQGTRWRG